MRLARWVCAVSLFAFVPCASFGQQHTLPLWPNGNPEPSTLTGPETDPTTDANRIVSGKLTVRITNVSKPTLSVYLPPKEKNTGAAALVLPGGAYIRLAWNLEGTEVCDWLNSIGMTCLLVKYRVPETGHYPDNVEDLEDAQQAMRIARAHAAEWGIDPQRIGAIGFSAGAHLAAALSTHSDFKGKNVPSSTADAKPNWQMLLYPGWLNGADGKVNPTVKPVSDTPPTFLVMAEDDYTAHVENALVYFQALKDVKVPAELHLFTQGGHGFGLRPTQLPISRWPTLAEAWLHTIHILGTPGPVPHP
ncbi:alpha/beta hydrolase [Terriglobus roseus]|uniref:Acetyl esterase/lipase n=1 Tax=Terriglobus roseus TaxID=392734 RepID=A0A1G7LHR3_9BACT|nr:alpha/beta hydrolase [Terriglobus roseus]SDF48983.1 Acetyl esterase/lipase [Terriglobus roseus]